MPINLAITSKFDPKGITQATSGLDKLGKLAGGFGIAAGAAFAAAGAGAAVFAAQSVKAAAESEAVSRSLQQIAKNSGVFGDTAQAVKKSTDEIMKYTKSLSNLVGIDDEILNSIVRGWLAVPELAGKGVDGLKDLVKVVADVAAGTGKDIAAIGMIFTKVAGDEETAMSKLARAGIVLSNSQKQIYEDTLATSGEIAAQDKLIEILGETYAGAAEAAANPFDVLSQNVANLQEDLGVYLLPALQKFIDKMREFIEKHGPEMEVAFQRVGEFAMTVVEAFGDFADWWAENPDLFNGIVIGLAGVTAGMIALNIAMAANPIGLVIALLIGVAAAVGFAATNMNRYATYFVGLWDFMRGGVLNAVQVIYNAVAGMVNSIVDGINRIVSVINLFGGSLELVGKMADINLGGTGIATQGAAAMNSTFLFGGASGGPVRPQGPMPFAEGGIVTSPVVGLVGEAGPEAIIPLDRLGKMGGATYNINVQAGVGDPQAIGQQIVAYIKRYEKASGPVFAGA